MIDNTQASWSNANFVILGLPYYSTCPVKAPRAYDSFERSFNSLSSLDMKSGIDPFDKYLIANPAPQPNYKLIEETIKKLNSGQNFILIGGEHLVTLPVIKALKPKRVIVFDAHADFYDEYNGRKESYATVTRRISELVDEVYLVGVRDLTIPEKEALKDSKKVKIISISDIPKIPKGDIHVSIDLDVLDPSQCPEVSTPVPLGISMSDLVNALKTICIRFNVTGLDVVELASSRQGLSSVNAAGIVLNYLWMRR